MTTARNRGVPPGRTHHRASGEITLDITPGVRHDGDDETREVVRRLLLDDTAWMTRSVWQGQAILRISVSIWRTPEEDVDRTIEAVRRVVRTVRATSGTHAGSTWQGRVRKG